MSLFQRQIFKQSDFLSLTFYAHEAIPVENLFEKIIDLRFSYFLYKKKCGQTFFIICFLFNLLCAFE